MDKRLTEWWWNGVREDSEKKREFLGRVVRRAWILWAMEQPDPKPSWLAPFDDLSEPDKEVDRRIAAAVEDALKVWAQPAHSMGIEGKEEQLRRLSESPIPGKTDAG